MTQLSITHMPIEGGGEGGANNKFIINNSIYLLNLWGLDEVILLRCFNRPILRIIKLVNFICFFLISLCYELSVM